MVASRCHKRTYAWQEARRRLQHPVIAQPSPPPRSGCPCSQQVLGRIVVASSSHRGSLRPSHRNHHHANRRRPPGASPPRSHHHRSAASTPCAHLHHRHLHRHRSSFALSHALRRRHFLAGRHPPPAPIVPPSVAPRSEGRGTDPLSGNRISPRWPDTHSMPLPTSARRLARFHARRAPEIWLA